MNTQIIKKLFTNRYSYLILFQLFLIYIHTNIIPIHPLLFLNWSLCIWFLFEMYATFYTNKLKIWLFIITSIIFVVLTSYLVVVSPIGIYYKLNTTYNLPTLSNFVFLEVLLLFLYDIFFEKSVTFERLPAYIGFASIIPWVSPAIVEANILIKWHYQGVFTLYTSGKGIGGAGLQDILFQYGVNNFLLSSFTFGLLFLTQYSYSYFSVMRENTRIKKKLKKDDQVWLKNAWENPISLLSEEEQRNFLNSHTHLDKEQQDKLLRDKILPVKGVFLIKPQKRKWGFIQ